jgi:hypothetical protein
MNTDNTVKHLSYEDRLIFKDQFKNTDNSVKHNVMIVRDADSGEVLLVRKNLVVRQGREFTLRKIFNMPYGTLTEANFNFTPTTGTETAELLFNRYINLFGIGKGGTPVADPFNPIPPTPADSDLTTPVVFRTSTMVEPLPLIDRPKYMDGRLDPSDNTVTLWYKKTFTSKEIVLDNVNNDYYVKIRLDVSNMDARDNIMNELCLYTSRYVNNAFIDFKVFSRITFPTEPLFTSNNKALVIDYYVYA